MIKMMARENMEEWGTSAWVELETIRAVVAAYGRGEITLPEVSKDTRKDLIRDVSESSRSRPYTVSTVATFLGWTSKNHGNGLRPNYACETAFKALDLIDRGLLREADVKGLKRSQLADLVTAQWSIYSAEKKVAEQNRQQEMIARDRATKAEATAERKRLEKQAKIRDMAASLGMLQECIIFPGMMIRPASWSSFTCVAR